MVQARHRAIAAEVQAQGRYSGESTANSAMRALRVLWNHLAEEVPDLGPNPVRRLRRQWYPERTRERLVRAEELPAFYGAVRDLPNPVHRDFLLLLLFTGLRRREAAGLTWEDIDLPAKIIRLPATRTKAGRKFDLPMSDVVLGIFIERQRLGRERFVFPADSRSRHIEEPKFALNLIARATGIRVSSHDLRRTFVTTAESTDNISPIALKCLVNHSTGAGDVTAAYVIMTVERLRDAAQRVADRLKVLCGVEPAGENVQMLPLAAAAHRV